MIRTVETIRCSLRFGDGGIPRVVAYPFAKIVIDGDHLSFSGGVFGRQVRELTRSQVVRSERTQRGVRWFADGFDQPWVTASLFPARFLRRLERHGFRVDGPIVPSRWNTI
jgi:hypothetical protein